MHRPIIIAIAAGLALAACAGPDGSSGDDAGPRELQLGRAVSGTIGTVGEVDWYHVSAVDANTLLRIECSSATVRADVELSVAVYEEDAAGERLRLAGDHAAEGSQLPPELLLHVYLDRPKELFIAVRDLLDDEASDHAYTLGVGTAAGDDGNATFTDAEPLAVDAPETPPAAAIDRVGDVDCYTFDAAAAGVYALEVAFAPFAGGTDVDLWLELYDADGVQVLTHAAGQAPRTRLLPNLAAGRYYLLVEDFGRNDSDAASLYGVSVGTMAVAERAANDSRDTAETAADGPDAASFAAAGALEYHGDADWYRLATGAVPTGGLKVLELAFDDTDPVACAAMNVSLQDASGVELLGHDHVAGSGPWASQVQVGAGDHYVAVRAAAGQTLTAACAYALDARVVDGDDPGEGDPGNDTIDTAEPLAADSDPISGWATGAVSFRGDRDWFSVATDNALPRVLELYFETDTPGAVDHAVSILRDDVEARVYDRTGGDGPTRLQTSLFLPAATPAGAVNYFFLVQDYQNDEGDPEVPYRIRTHVAEVPDTLAPNPELAGPTVYFGEAAERDAADAVPVQLEHTSLAHPTFLADTGLLAFADPDASPDVTRTVNGDGTVTLTFPWVRGYVDYQGDQDWFALDLGPLGIEGELPATAWYYDLQLELHTAAPGSEVEYVWKLYRDENQNGIVVDRADDSNGFFASDGDPDTAAAGFTRTTPVTGSGAPFWVGDAWEGRFYLALSDFEYVDATEPDADWGYAGAPYAFRLTLTYHPGVSYPQ